ncbi:hypothetical protein M406DRAFT_67231 [Cryphonectria parasitica EP155]|uniref:Ankyrin repeat protein n=1 Tax=Cryphonectria parasitica (strain ATCC 38755 / EP155) TaxID=660469 RepID=A0A9P5CVT9_CRYP1|nr:uncharacterized protein M406DRAFT_67231 [Cryphonectria parasitica EP155]KAF3770870.1 hypothetical protein M406DRAFT_67231 [Cryphonectria parasitica EP155]
MDQDASRAAAFQDCWTALETKDVDAFGAEMERSSGCLSTENMRGFLTQTIKEDWVDGARYLLGHGAKTDMIGPVMLARHCRSVAMLELLSEHGTEFSHPTENILPARMVLFRREILDWLLDYGLDINGPSNNMLYGANNRVIRDKTVEVLNRAAAAGDIELFDHLAARGADPGRSNALHNAAGSSRGDAAAAAMINHLVDRYHLDVNAGDDCHGLNEMVTWQTPPGTSPHYTTPLVYAARASNVAAAEALLHRGARVAEALSAAVVKRNAQLVGLLLDHGADPSRGLAAAVVQGFVEGARLCLEHGADVARGREEDRFVAALGGAYAGMSSEMRALLDDHKSSSG